VTRRRGQWKQNPMRYETEKQKKKKINETKTWSLVKINNINKSLARLIKGKDKNGKY
jgi:hypothetical protein